MRISRFSMFSFIVILLLLPCSAAPATVFNPLRSSQNVSFSLRSDNSSAIGLTASLCRLQRECISPRICRRRFRIGSGRVCGTDWICICFPPEPLACTSSADCVKGEECYESLFFVHPICVWDKAAVEREWLEKLPESTEIEDVVPSPSPISPLGLTFDPCLEDVDCKGDRVCEYYGYFRALDDSVSCAGVKPCYCVQDFDPCFGPADCEPGEVCANVVSASVPTCASKRAVGVGIALIKLNSEPTGLNFDSCYTSDDCQGTRVCAQIKLFPPDLRECEGNRPCACLPRSGIVCEETKDCDSGEVCARFPLYEVLVCMAKRIENVFTVAKEISAGITPTPASRPQASPSGSSSPAAVKGNQTDRSDSACIDVRALRRLRRNALVFTEDLWAKVLCDERGVCATEGHVIVFRGVPMMMKSYCELTNCSDREMYVNSPKYRRGLRVSSNNKEVEYSAFAARYGTSAEERLLCFAIHVGF